MHDACDASTVELEGCREPVVTEAPADHTDVGQPGEGVHDLVCGS